MSVWLLAFQANCGTQTGMGFCFMSIKAKHSYRFGFLKSEKWSNIRLSILVHHEGKCYVCGFEAHNNDVHHVVYPKNWSETDRRHAVVLCRDCHASIHSIIDLVKIETNGIRWKAFHAIVAAVKDAAFNARKQNTKLYMVKVNKEKPKPKPSAKCVCCRGQNATESNLFAVIGRQWEARCCDSCRKMIEDELLKNRDMIIKPTNAFKIVKSLFKRVRLSIDNPVPMLECPSAS